MPSGQNPDIGQPVTEDSVLGVVTNGPREGQRVPLWDVDGATEMWRPLGTMPDEEVLYQAPVPGTKNIYYADETMPPGWLELAKKNLALTGSGNSQQVINHPYFRQFAKQFPDAPESIKEAAFHIAFIDASDLKRSQSGGEVNLGGVRGFDVFTEQTLALAYQFMVAEMYEKAGQKPPPTKWLPRVPREEEHRDKAGMVKK